MENGLVFIIVTFGGLAVSLIITPYIGKFMISINKTGQDVHKIDGPLIPESGGIGFMLLFLLILIIGIFISPTTGITGMLIISFVVLLLVVIIGLYDDFKGLSAKIKPFILVIAATPVIIFRTYKNIEIADPHPSLPFVGDAQLTIVYWGLAIFVIAIPSNASNMLDVMNGVMSFSGILILATAFIVSFIVPLSPDSVFYIRFVSLGMIGVLSGFWWYNKYPASIFAGDTGSLGVGATIGLIAIYGQIEFVIVIALLVHIMNSFSIIGSVKGLRERREMHRPVVVEDGLIYASKNDLAPITLVRLLTANEGLPEDKIVKKILLLVFYSCVLALISAYLMSARLVFV